MTKFFISIFCFLFVCTHLTAQIAETEPNDSKTASGVITINSVATITGNVDGLDFRDWWKIAEGTEGELIITRYSFHVAGVYLEDDTFVAPDNIETGSGLIMTKTYTLNSTQNYYLRISEGVPSISASRSLSSYTFDILGSALPLPVELLYFSVATDKSDNNLTWQTATENNNSGFEIQNSTSNSDDWERIGFVNGKGTTDEQTDYSFVDSNPYLGTNYYRLKQLDFDGAFAYSEVVKIENQNKDTPLQVFPNPSGGLINLQIDNPFNKEVKVRIMDNSGREISESVISNFERNISVEIANSGVYLISVEVGNEVFRERVIIIEK